MRSTKIPLLFLPAAGVGENVEMPHIADAGEGDDHRHFEGVGKAGATDQAVHGELVLFLRRGVDDVLHFLAFTENGHGVGMVADAGDEQAAFLHHRLQLFGVVPFQYLVRVDLAIVGVGRDLHRFVAFVGGELDHVLQLPFGIIDSAESNLHDFPLCV